VARTEEGRALRKRHLFEWRGLPGRCQNGSPPKAIGVDLLFLKDQHLNRDMDKGVMKTQLGRTKLNSAEYLFEGIARNSQQRVDRGTFFLHKFEENPKCAESKMPEDQYFIRTSTSRN
jgi:hypothetical protein